MEVKPGRAVSIIECDMNVEFDAPEGYVEPNINAASSSNAAVGFISVQIEVFPAF